MSAEVSLKVTVIQLVFAESIPLSPVLAKAVNLATGATSTLGRAALVVALLAALFANGLVLVGELHLALLGLV